MIQVTTKRVSLVKGDSGRAKPEDEYDVNFVYGPEASNADVTKRHLEPLVKKVIEGYNATVLCFGATGSGKTTSLEGMRRDGKAASEGDGAVHLVCDALFRLLNDKAVHVGDRVAVSQGARAKSYDFFVEASFVEVANEECHDLLQKGGATRANLPLYEDDLDGYQLSGLTYRMAKASTELRQSFNYGRLMRDFSEPDVGSVHERSAGIFTIYLAQYSPALAMGQEDSVMASRLTIVDMPGAERLAVEPELLRLREGALLNKSLLGYASTVGTLARDGSSQFVNYDECVLTRLLADALGGNSLALVMGCLRQGDWEGSVTTLQHLQLVRKVRNFPIINHGRARGLLQSIRRRLLSLVDDRNTLREQLDEVPADGDPNAVAVSIARLRDIEAQLIAERNEKAAMGEEKNALAARLRRLQDAESGDLQERAELHEALIKSEEMRLELAKNLIAAQVDMNEKEREYADEKLDLEKKIVELEAIKVSDYVKSDDAAALEQQRDQLNTELLDTQDELVRREKEVEELKRTIGEQQEELRKLHNDLNLIGGEGDAKDLDFADAEAEGADGDSVEARRRKLFMQLKLKTRQIEELRSAMKDLQKEMDKLRNKRNLTQAGVDEMREAYRRKLEGHMRDIGDMSRAVAIMQDDPKTGLRVSPEDLFKAFQKLTDENVEVTAQRESDLREDLDDLHGRHVELKRKFRTLYLAYRDLRYLVEDKWPNPGVPPRPDVPHEDSVLEAAFDDLTRSEEEADRRLVARLRERASHLDAQLAAIKLSQAAGEKGIKLRPTDYSSVARADGAAGPFVGASAELLRRPRGPRVPFRTLRPPSPPARTRALKVALPPRR